MQNPFSSEARAYRFLLATIVAFAAIIVAALVGGTWWGVGVAVLAAAVALWWLLRPEAVEPVVTAPAHSGPADEKRILEIGRAHV